MHKKALGFVGKSNIRGAGDFSKPAIVRPDCSES